MVMWKFQGVRSVLNFNLQIFVQSRHQVQVVTMSNVVTVIRHPSYLFTFIECAALIS